VEVARRVVSGVEKIHGISPGGGKNPAVREIQPGKIQNEVISDSAGFEKSVDMSMFAGSIWARM
jgi:hypothetical protein